MAKRPDLQCDHFDARFELGINLVLSLLPAGFQHQLGTTPCVVLFKIFLHNVLCDLHRMPHLALSAVSSISLRPCRRERASIVLAFRHSVYSSADSSRGFL